VYFKKLIGKKCYLSPMDINDAEKYTVWLNDLEITTNLSIFHSVINVEIEKEYLENLSKEHNYSIIDMDTDELIGSCGFIGLDHLNQIAEIGLFIGNKNYWNKGYGTESMKLLLDYGFNALNLNNVMLRVYSFNERAIKMYKKLGFQVIGNRRESLKRGNKVYDEIYMDILAKEYIKNN
jgi:RimJ/RimL family protein N-acetyltransferase